MNSNLPKYGFKEEEVDLMLNEAFGEGVNNVKPKNLDNVIQVNFGEKARLVLENKPLELNNGFTNIEGLGKVFGLCDFLYKLGLDISNDKDKVARYIEVFEMYGISPVKSYTQEINKIEFPVYKLDDYGSLMKIMVEILNKGKDVEKSELKTDVVDIFDIQSKKNTKRFYCKKGLDSLKDIGDVFSLDYILERYDYEITQDVVNDFMKVLQQENINEVEGALVMSDFYNSPVFELKNVGEVEFIVSTRTLSDKIAS